MIPALDKTHQNPTNQKLTHHKFPVAISNPPPPQKPPRHFNSKSQPTAHHPNAKKQKNHKRLNSNGRQSWSQALEAIEWSTPERQTHHKFPKNKSSPPRFPHKIKKPTTENFPKPPKIGWNRMEPQKATLSLLTLLPCSSFFLILTRQAKLMLLLLMTMALEWVSLSTFPRQSSHECIIKFNNTPHALFKVTPLSYDHTFTQGECRWSMIDGSLPAG